MVSIAQKMTRAFLVGLTIGIIAGLGFYFMTTAINMIAGSTVFDPIAMLILTMGFVLGASIAIELSGDISAKQATENTASQSKILDIGPNLTNELQKLELLMVAQGQKKQEDGPPAPKPT